MIIFERQQNNNSPSTTQRWWRHRLTGIFTTNDAQPHRTAEKMTLS